MQVSHVGLLRKNKSLSHIILGLNKQLGDNLRVETSKSLDISDAIVIVTQAHSIYLGIVWQ